MHKQLNEDLSDAIRKIQDGDGKSRNDFISYYKKFILSSASRASKRYLREGMDDEYSIALSAFNEAIDHYDPSRGVTFFTFSDTVIKRRLIDYFRQQSSRREIPLSSFEDEDRGQFGETSTDSFADEQEEGYRREEINLFNKAIDRYGFSLQDVARVCPKHQDSRQTAQDIARKLASDHDLMNSLLINKTLPTKLLAISTNVSHKIINRQRIYIIALAVLINGNFPMLKEFIS